MNPQSHLDPIRVSLEILLPNGGMVLSMQAAFDDSGNSDQSLTVVAGYFFRDDALTPFRNEWRDILAGRRFHMIDLVHGNNDFSNLDKAARAVLSVKLIDSIKRHMTLGSAIALENRSYHKYIAETPEMRESVGSPYAMCAMLCLATSARWMEANNIEPEETVYYFESGNSKQADADSFLNTIQNNPSMDERYRYVSHGFVKKNKLATLDAADLLGWEWTQQCRRMAGDEKRPTRASLKSLTEKPHIGEYFQGVDVHIAFARALLEPYVTVRYGQNFVRPSQEITDE